MNTRSAKVRQDLRRNDEAERGLWKRHWPLLVSVSLYCGVTSLLVVLSIHRNQGHFIYALDDAYVHMAIAKNLVRHGVWGVTPFEFSSSTSSILWPLLLALSYKLFGVNETAPLIWSALSAVGVLWVGYWVLSAFRLRKGHAFAILLLLLLATPLVPLTLTGMEHTFQAALTLGLVFCSAKAMGPSADRQGSAMTGRRWIGLLCLAAAVTAVRYEGLFVILAITLILLARRQWRHALLFCVCGILPVACFGLICHGHGWPLLPAPVLVKRSLYFGSPSDFATNILASLVVNCMLGPSLAALLVLVAWLYSSSSSLGRPHGTRADAMAAIFIITAALHLGLAAVGWFYRYEAYLVALGITVAACQLSELGSRDRAGRGGPARVVMIAIAVTIALLAWRGQESLRKTVAATANIYDQQYQMALFIHTYYEGSTIALNDLGAVNYLADVHCLDLAGLATRKVLEARLHEAYTTTEIQQWSESRGVQVALAYPPWFNEIGGLPKSWIKVGEWAISKRTVTVGDSISIFATTPEEVPGLVKNLRAFSPQMPPEVRQTGLYELPMR